jgi:hypothetical protein
MRSMFNHAKATVPNPWPNLLKQSSVRVVSINLIIKKTSYSWPLITANLRTKKKVYLRKMCHFIAQTKKLNTYLIKFNTFVYQSSKTILSVARES